MLLRESATVMAEAGHLDADTVAAWVDGTLDASARALADAHLAECAECRSEVVAVNEVVGSWRRGGPRLQWLRPLAIAAALLLAIGLPLAMQMGQRDQSRVRRPVTELPAELQAVSPAPEVALTPGTPLLFTWRSFDSGSTFRLTLTDESGGTVWSVETGDTSVALPESVALPAGRTWFWYVDAIRSDGRSVSTGAHRFTTR